ncbi:MAG: penicillin-binding transpeptidase domain-containing protein, partial [Pontibacterium sp.]
IGSLVKPAVYLAALESGYTLGSLLNDTPFKVKMPDGQMWIPKNFDKQSHGKVPLHWALSQSYNLSTAQLGMQVGIGKVIDMLERLGVTQEVKPYPSLMLGAESMSPYQVAMMYQTFAANGFKTPLRAIRSVTSADGGELSRYPLAVEQTVDPAHIHLIQYGLQEVMREGTARHAYTRISPTINLAGKTGTSNDQRDSWFAGFAGNRLGVVWVGKDDNAQLPFTGSGGALRVWTDFMVREKPLSFEPVFPENVEYIWTDSVTGLRSAEACAGARQLPYVAGTEPSEYIPCAQPNQIERARSWFKGWF